MTTTNVNISDTAYTQVTTGADFFVENTSAVRIRYAVSDTLPAVDAPFHKLDAGCVITSSLLTGTVWARTETGAGNVTVSE